MNLRTKTRFGIAQSLGWLGLILAGLDAGAAPAEEHVLWYRQPAAGWHEALPVGNGRLGAMVFGGTAQERLALNEGTIWSGKPIATDRVGAHRHLPEIRRLLFADQPAEAEALVTKEVLGERPLGSYQPLGDLFLELAGHQAATDFRRELDLEAAVARTTYRVGGVAFVREMWASAPHDVIVVRLTADRPGQVTLEARLSRAEGAEASSPAENDLELRGQADRGKPTAGVSFVGRLRARAEGGTVSSHAGRLRVERADAVTLLITAATDYRGGDPAVRAAERLAAVSVVGLAELQAAHRADHQKLYRRAALELGGTAASPLPTDERLQRVRAGANDEGLLALYFHLGRYLMIGSSRPGNLPANLQGIWNDRMAPPWFCGWHFDVNAQMIYWPAETTNLSECHEPFLDLIERLREPGRKTARDVYGTRGFVVSHRTNAWLFTSPVKGLTTWPPGAGWLCQHLWERYRFSGDRDFLAGRAYPVMREAAEFFLDWLVADPRTGLLVSGPSMSPENSYLLPPSPKPHGLAMGPTMDQQIVAELFDHCLAAARVLGIDDGFVREVRGARAKLAGSKVGPDGRLLEWLEPRQEREPGHRHISHLYALYPGGQITPRDTPELAEAARKSLAYRLSSGGTTRAVNVSDSSNVGWSLAWNTGLWARMGDGAQAHQTLTSLLRRAAFPNLFDCHPQKDTPGVFQIDGNLGGAAAVAEMLVQSHRDEIELLPALPSAWPAGKVRGLRARGAYEVDLEWRESRLERATIRAAAAGTLRVRLGDKAVERAVRAGEVVSYDAALQGRTGP
jgi:alpha-L-fucosidase 2